MQPYIINGVLVILYLASHEWLSMLQDVSQRETVTTVNTHVETKQLEELSCSFHLPLLIMNTMINRHYCLIPQVCTIYLPSHLVQRTACRMPEQMQSPAIEQEMQSSEKTG